MRKKIKKSIRGVTFSAESKRFPVGSHYRYRVDVKNRKLIIVSSETGNTVSRKKSGAVIKPLFDIRSKEVKEQLAACDFMEIEVQENEIHVFFCKKLLSFLERKMHRTEEVLGASITGCVSIPVNMLPAASGGECYSQITIADYLSRITPKATKDDERGIRKDLDAVFKVISLFSGAGLLDYPFARDPVFDICYAVDCDASACESYRRNIGPHIHCKKTSDISLAELPDANVVIGGPSCKAVSNENRRTRMANHQDYNLIDDYIRVVAETRPDVFAIENVPEFLTAGQGEQIEKVVSSLGEYCISSVVVMDGDLGGYSLRKRAIIVGSRIGEIKFPDIKVVTRHTVREALNKVNATWFNYDDLTLPSKRTKNRMALVPPGGNFKNIPDLAHLNSHSIRYKRLEYDGLAPTLVNWRKAPLIHPEENRTLTVAEAIALMGFGKDLVALGNLSEKQQQIGNGVPYSIGKFVKNVIKKALISFYSSTSEGHNTPIYSL